jgi:hypothetical protein
MAPDPHGLKAAHGLTPGWGTDQFRRSQRF